MDGINVFYIIPGIIIGIFLFLLPRLSLRRNKTPKYDGFIDISKQDASQIYQLEITIDPEQLRKKKRVLFKVRIIPD